jgi:5-methyltetrahydropteroyltriglutamate--homocysteine methyltransferase
MLRLPVKQLHLAFKNTDFAYLKLIDQFGYDDDKDLGVGVTDVHTRFLETVEEVKDGIKQTLQRLPANRLWIYPDCGLKTRTTEESEDKLRVMVEAVRAVKRELGIS